jgi:hypothetical protein
VYPFSQLDLSYNFAAADRRALPPYSLQLQVQLYSTFRRAFLSYLRLNALDKASEAVIARFTGRIWAAADGAVAMDRRRSVREQIRARLFPADVEYVERRLAEFLDGEPAPLTNTWFERLSEACAPLCIRLISHRHSAEAATFHATRDPAAILSCARLLFADLFRLAGPGHLTLPVKKRRAAAAASSHKRKGAAAGASATTADEDEIDEAAAEYVTDKDFDAGAVQTDAVLRVAFREEWVDEDAQKTARI